MDAVLDRTPVIREAPGRTQKADPTTHLEEPSLLTVRRGRVQVNEIDVVTAHHDVIVWEVDLVSKYAEVFGYSSSTRCSSVLLAATDRTLYLDEDADRDTELVFQPSDGGRWLLLAGAMRYTVQVVAYRVGTAEAG